MPNLELLRKIADSTATGALVYVGKDDGQPLIGHNPPLISVDASQHDPNDGSKIAAHLTDAGAAYLASHNGHAKPATHMFAIETGIVLPKSKRGGGGGGAPTKYPFETMEVGSSFFVANTDVNKGDAVKTLASAAGSANQRYSEDVIENGQVKTKTVTRVKRDNKNKAVKDAQGNNVKETVTIHEKKATRKFVVRPVKGGVQYGSWTAPADGAIVQRVAVS